MNNKEVKMLLYVVIIFFIFFGIVSCKKANRQISKKEQITNFSLRLNWIPDPTFTGVYIEAYSEIAKKYGISINIQPGGYNLDPIGLVLSGQNDIGLESAGRVISAMLKGYPIKVIFAEFQKNPVGWIVKKDKGINSPKDFIGRKMGEKYGTESEIITEALFSLLKIDIKKLNRIPVQFAIQPFLDDQVEIFPCYMNEEPIRISKKGYKIKIIDPSDYGLRMYGNVIFVKEDFLKKNKKSLVKFVKGLKEAWSYSIKNNDKAYNLLVKNMKGLDKLSGKDVMLKTFDFVTYDVGMDKIGFIDKKKWDNTVNIILNFNKKIKGVKIDKEKAYNGYENLIYK